MGILDVVRVVKQAFPRASASWGQTVRWNRLEPISHGGYVEEGLNSTSGDEGRGERRVMKTRSRTWAPRGGEEHRRDHRGLVTDVSPSCSSPDDDVPFVLMLLGPMRKPGRSQASRCG